jgi:Fe-S cluster assembly ATPase SufC
MAMRIHDRELGVRLRNPLTCTKEEVLEALYEILEPVKYERVVKNLKMVRSLLQRAVGEDFAGGAKVSVIPSFRGPISTIDIG